nr:MAG TPA: hypothetical protein [Bacteriophage sp.]
MNILIPRVSILHGFLDFSPSPFSNFYILCVTNSVKLKP